LRQTIVDKYGVLGRKLEEKRKVNPGISKKNVIKLKT
jgi:hypothetical protein